MLICTFSCKADDFTAEAEIAFLFVRILDHHGNSGARFHILVLDAALIRIDQDIIAIGIEPDWSHLQASHPSMIVPRYSKALFLLTGDRQTQSEKSCTTMGLGINNVAISLVNP